MLRLSNIAPSAAKRLFKAMSRLCSARIADRMNLKHDEKRTLSNAAIRIIESVRDDLVESAGPHTHYARVAITKQLSRMAGEQFNLDSIAAAAVSELERDASEIEPEVQSQEGSTISDEFLDGFESVAKTKSTDEMRLLFARILAGEIKKPGSFSVKTLKIAEQLDQDIAKLFQRLCSLCCRLSVDLTIPREGRVEYRSLVDDVRVFSVGGKGVGENGLGEYGLPYASLMLLGEYGLISSELSSRIDYWFCVVSGRKTVTSSFRHQSLDWVLVPVDTGQQIDHLWLSGVMLSSVGKELYSIVEQSSTASYTVKLREFFLEKSLRMAEVGASSDTSR